MALNIDKARDIFKSCEYVLCNGDIYACRLSSDGLNLKLYLSKSATVVRVILRIRDAEDLGGHWLMRDLRYNYRIKPINLTYIIPSHEPK